VLQNVQAYYDVGAKLADSDMWPTWSEGSEFRAAREAMLAKPAAKAKKKH